MKHKYQTQFCACREFRFQHFVELALDKNFKKSKCLQRAQQLPFSLLIFSALWEGGQWIRKSPGTFRSQTQRDRQTNKTETKTFSQLLLIFIKKLLDRNFHQPSEKFLWHRKQEILQFQEFFTVTNIISIRWNSCSFPCVYLWRWMPGWQEILASWKKLKWGMS